MNHERIYDLSVVSKSQDRKIFYGVNYKGNFGLYVDYAREGYLNAGIYNLTSFYGFDFINALHSMSCRMTDNDISQKMQSHFFEVDSSLSRKVNISKQIDVIPHFSLTYSKILALDGGFVHENRLFEVQANQKAGFYVKAGIDAVSKMNIKSIDCEAFVTVDVSNKGYDRISFVSGDIEIAGRSEFLPSISMGVNTKFSQDSKMYARTKIHFEKSLFEVGLNIKI